MKMANGESGRKQSQKAACQRESGAKIGMAASEISGMAIGVKTLAAKSGAVWRQLMAKIIATAYRHQRRTVKMKAAKKTESRRKLSASLNIMRNETYGEKAGEDNVAAG